MDRPFIGHAYPTQHDDPDCKSEVFSTVADRGKIEAKMNSLKETILGEDAGRIRAVYPRAATGDDGHGPGRVKWRCDDRAGQIWSSRRQ
jgi:hypothetical protein